MAQRAIKLQEDHRVTYLERMIGPMKDKLFFVDQLPEEVRIFIDYGCADGTLLYYLSLEKLNKNCYYFGFDEDTGFIASANSKGIPNAFFSTSFQDLMHEVFMTQETLDQNAKTALILSSVLHEIQSYLSHTDINKTYDEFFGVGPDYVVIRDMGFDPSEFDKPTFFHDTYSVADGCEQDINLSIALKTFTEKWGDIDVCGRLVHFLLKYKYTDNWVRELNEDYLINLEELHEDLHLYGYDITYQKYYPLPYLQEMVRKDFGIMLDDNTHFQIIAKRKDE
jgi:hypothetical protein